MKFITCFVALTAFVAAHDGPHDSQGNALDNQGNLIKFSNGTVPAYPIPPSQQTNSNGSQNQSQYPLPPDQGGNNSNGSQSGNNSSGNQNGGNQGGKQYPTPPSQGQQPNPTPIPSKPSGDNQAAMEEFQKFLQSPFMVKFMEYFKMQHKKQY